MKNKIKLFYLIAVLSINFTGCLFPTETLEDDNCIVENDFNKSKLYVFGTDFESGIINKMPVDNQKWECNEVQVHSDNRLKSNAGFLYVLERYGADNILKLDPAEEGEAAVVYQTHLGDHWNPQDIAFVSETKAYVAVENVPYILVFNPKSGQVTDSIITREYIYEPGENDSGYAATTPHCHSLGIYNGYLYAALQRRNGNYLFPGGKSMVLKINVDNNKIESSLELKYRNATHLEIVSGEIYVSTLGSYGDFTDGAIEKLDFKNNKTEVIISEEKFGGDMAYFIPKEGSLFYALCYVTWGEVSVKLLDFSKKKVLSKLDGITDAGSSLLYDASTQRLFVTERAPTASGLKIFNNKEELIAGPLEMEVPPSSMAIVEPQL